jgi:hypothetical protein
MGLTQDARIGKSASMAARHFVDIGFSEVVAFRRLQPRYYLAIILSNFNQALRCGGD